MAKFKVNDKVEITNRSGLTGKVKSITVDFFGEHEYQVTFDDSTLLPNTMTYYEEDLNLIGGLSSHSTSPSFQSSISPWAEKYYSLGNSKETHCPKCDKKWHEHRAPGDNELWKDCLDCNIRFEDC